MAHLLGAESINLEYPSRVVFNSVTLGISEGDRIGVVGRNGDGKSSLLKVLTGQLSPNSGRVTTRRGLHIGILDQIDTLDDHHTVGHAIVGDVDEHVWARNPVIREVMSGLIADIDWNASIANLSGGQRRRVALASLLVGDHDVVFLDEPTNHLDIEAIAWLAGHLKKRWASDAGGLLVVTHDRWFLDEVCTTTWEVHDGVVDPFDGGYAAYVLQRVERDRIAATVESKRQNLMRKELAWLRRGPPARTSKPKFRIDAANALIATEPPVRDTVGLQQMAMTRLGKQVVDLENASVSFDGRSIFSGVNWKIAPGERAAILGINGAGKSTLLNLITGRLKPTSGEVKHGQTVKVAVLSQQSTELQEFENERVREVLGRKRKSYVVNGKETTSAQLLEQLGFKNADMSSFIKELSGGQRRRLQLLLTLLDEPNVLVMDEPTNDLDTDMLAAMEDLLDTWPGTLIVVSHDRYLMERVTDQQYAILGGQLRHLPGGVDQYMELVGALRNSTGSSKSSASPAGSSAAAPKSAADKSAATMSNLEARGLQKEFASVERKLAKIPQQIEQLNVQISDHDQSDYLGLAKLVEQVNELQAKQSTLEERWLEISELFD